MRKILSAILFVLPVMLFCSCAAPSEELEPKLRADEVEELVEEEVTSEVQTNKPLYVYGDSDNEPFLNEIVLKLNAEPLLLKNQDASPGYVRLVGVVSGGKPLALLELGGRGVFVGLGDRISSYSVTNICSGKVYLEKNREGVK